MKDGFAWFIGICLVILALGGLISCLSPSTNVERSTESATALAYTAYVGWTNALNQYPNLNQYTGLVHEARLKFAASVKVVDALNASYATNGVAQSVVTGALDTALANASNLVWLVEYLKAK